MPRKGDEAVLRSFLNDNRVFDFVYDSPAKIIAKKIVDAILGEAAPEWGGGGGGYGGGGAEQGWPAPEAKHNPRGLEAREHWFFPPAPGCGESVQVWVKDKDCGGTVDEARVGESGNYITYDFALAGACGNANQLSGFWGHGFVPNDSMASNLRYFQTGTFVSPYWQSSALWSRQWVNGPPCVARGLSPQPMADEDDDNLNDRPKRNYKEPESPRRKKPPRARPMDEWFPFLPIGAVLPPPLRGQMPRKRPRRRQDKKVRSKILALMNVVSESAEVLDAIFEALPCHIQKAAKAKARPKAGLLDNAGQYGIDGADWKTKAIWDNWDAVDGALAASNIIRNEIQDRAFGEVYKRLPGGLGAVADLPGKAVGKENKPPSLNDLIDPIVQISSASLGLVPERKCK